LQAQQKPNIIVLCGDDIGIANINAYSGGVMGYKTPNIDLLTKECICFQLSAPNGYESTESFWKEA
jgi:arylsulfatase